MKITTVLCSEHIGNAFKRHWKVQSQRQVFEYGNRKQLESKGIQVLDAVKVFQSNLRQTKPELEKSSKVEYLTDKRLQPRLTCYDSTHPDWHDEPCRVFHNHSKLVCGLDQGLNLVKTGLVANELPDRINKFKSELSTETHRKAQKAILDAHALDSLQLKLPKKIDVSRPGWNHPREYGLPKWRRNQQLLAKLFHIADTTLAKKGANILQTQFVNEVKIRTPLKLDKESLLFDLNVSHLLFNKKPLQPYADSEFRTEFLSKPLPSIYPVNPTISIFEQNIYRMEHLFPVRKGAPLENLSMAIFSLNMPFIKQSHNELQGRLLLQAFGVLAAYARKMFGENVEELPQPLTLNCIHTDSQNFLFGCLEVNSLNIRNTDSIAKNLFWVTDNMQAFSKCEYVNGQLVFEGYNPQVIETLMAMHHSQLSL